MKRRIIRDPVHRDISLSPLEMKIVETPEFQRLRFVKQLGLVFLVFPGANHTRFEHSLGTKYVAELILNRVTEEKEIDSEETELVKVAALLHDAAHPPFSHTLDVILPGGEKWHEIRTEKVVKETEIADCIHKHGYSPQEIIDVLRGRRGILSKVIRSDVDADRLDYLLRDAYFCGVAYGIIDRRVLDEFRAVNDELVFSHKGLQLVVTVLFARFEMYTIVYNHKTVQIAASMLNRIVYRALKEKLLNENDLYEMTDCDLLYTLKSCGGYFDKAIRRLERRKLLKQAYSKSWSEMDQDKREEVLRLRETPEKIFKLEEEISSEIGAEDDKVIIHIPPKPEIKEAEVKVVFKEGICRASDLSPIIKSLREAYIESWNFSVFTVERKREKVKKLCESFFDD